MTVITTSIIAKVLVLQLTIVIIITILTIIVVVVVVAHDDAQRNGNVAHVNSSPIVLFTV